MSVLMSVYCYHCRLKECTAFFSSQISDNISSLVCLFSAALLHFPPLNHKRGKIEAKRSEKIEVKRSETKRKIYVLVSQNEAKRFLFRFEAKITKKRKWDTLP